MAGASLSRRGFLATGAVALAGTVGYSPAQAQERKLRLNFWGSKDRADRTAKAVAIHVEKTPGLAVDSEFVGWGDYWPRMATQAAAKNLSDIVQMDYVYLYEYARRGALMPLDGFLGQDLDIADFAATSIACGKVDGKLYGINLGNNSLCVLYNRGVLERLGLKQPANGANWTAFAALATEIGKASKGAVFGTTSTIGSEPILECWLRQRGKALYSADGKPGFTADDIAAWFDFWLQLRASGGSVPPDIQALSKDTIDTDALTLGKAAMTFANSNQLVGFQALNKDKIGIGMFPTGDKPGQYLKPSMFFSVSAHSKLGPDAARLINTFIRDPAAVAALSVERGVPASAAARLALAPTLDELGRAAVTYISEISDKVGPLPPPPPKGAGEVMQLLRKASEQVTFGKLAPKEAARTFVDDVTNTLDRG